MSIFQGYLGPNKLLNSPKVATHVVLGYGNARQFLYLRYELKISSVGCAYKQISYHRELV